MVLWSLRVNSRYSLFVFRDSFSEHVWVSHAHSHALSKKVWTNFLGIMPQENGEDSKHTNGFARTYIQITEVTSLTPLLFHSAVFKDRTILGCEVNF